MNKNIDNKEIIIKKVKGRQREYTASFYARFFKATYTLNFNDNVFGAVALTRFYEMIKNSFNTKQVNLIIYDNLDTDNTKFINLLNNKRRHNK